MQYILLHGVRRQIIRPLRQLIYIYGLLKEEMGETRAKPTLSCCMSLDKGTTWCKQVAI